MSASGDAARRDGAVRRRVGKVLRAFEALGIELDALMLRNPPAWTVQLTAAAAERHARLAAHRPPRPHKPRKDITPPDDYPQKHLW